MLDLELMTQEYSVLLTDTKRTSCGSGVIYYPGIGDKFYVFTCAHVVDDLQEPIEIHMLVPYNRENEGYTECCVEVNKNQIVYASTDSITTENGNVRHSVDVAVIFVGKDSKLNIEKTPYYVAEAKKSDKVLIQGYPGGMQFQCGLIDSLDVMYGRVLHNLPQNSYFTIRAEDSFIDNSNRVYELKGFSGAPLWHDSDEVLSLFGLLSEGIGDSVYRAKINAVKMNSIRSIMKNRFHMELETRIVGIPEKDVAEGNSELKFDGRVEIPKTSVYDEWIDIQTGKVREYIDEIQFQKAIDIAKDTINDEKFDNCSNEKKKRYMQYLLYCYECCLLNEDYRELEIDMNRRHLLEGHDPLRWMTYNFGKREFKITQHYAEKLIADCSANEIVMTIAKMFSAICRGYTEQAPVEETILKFLDEREKLKIQLPDLDTEALVYQMLGYTYQNCYQESVKAVRCLNRAYRIGHDNAVLESLGNAYYFLSLNDALRKDNTVIADKLDRAALYKARTCFLLILQKTDDLYRRAMFKREGMVIFNTFFFLNDEYQVLTLYHQIRDCLPELQDNEYRDIELKYARIYCRNGMLDMNQFQHLNDEDKKLIEVVGQCSYVLHKLDAFPFCCHPSFQNELFSTIKNAEDGLSRINEKELVAVRINIINLYGWGHKLFGWNIAASIKKHIEYIEDEKIIRAFKNFLIENTEGADSAENGFIAIWQESQDIFSWQQVLNFYKRNALFDNKWLDKADVWYKKLFAEYFDYIKSEPEYAYRAYIDYVMHYRRDIRDAIEIYLAHKDEMQDKNISEFFKWELRMYTNCFNNPEEFDEERKLFVEDGLLPEDEYHRTSLIGYMENLDAENAWRHFSICNPSFGRIEDKSNPMLTSEGAHFLVWQGKYPGHKEEKWHGISNSDVNEILVHLDSEKWHVSINDIKKKYQYDVCKSIAIDAWSLYLLAYQNRLDDLEYFDTVFVTHCTINRLMEELCHYENAYIRIVLEYIQCMEHIKIISADLREQLAVREKTLYDEPGSTIAVGMVHNCLVIVSEPNIIKQTISAFKNCIVRVTDIDKMV